ncbi:hypothetical protein ACGFK1_11480 [Mycobacterium sp. NPDC048908]|uniref:hypothetical protein n=1 Tax=Mycobacterium sp. NPDC048908 TaxID=3364292 RepID=UPI003716EE54
MDEAPTYAAMKAVIEDRVLRANLEAPPLNLIGPELVRDTVSLIRYLESHERDVSVVVFDSAQPDYFSASKILNTDPIGSPEEMIHGRV